MLSLTGWVVFLLTLPIFHPRWVAYSNYHHCQRFRHDFYACWDNFRLYGMTIISHATSRDIIGGRLPDGKSREN